MSSFEENFKLEEVEKKLNNYRNSIKYLTAQYYLLTDLEESDGVKNTLQDIENYQNLIEELKNKYYISSMALEDTWKPL